MNQQIDPGDRLEHLGRELFEGVFVVGDVGDSPLVKMQDIAEGRIRMRQPDGGHAYLRVQRDGVATGEFAEINLRPEQVLHLHWEERVLDLIRHQLHERVAASGFAINRELIFR
jgi:hypothetical protein